jgi:hypothetical protein
MNTPIIGRVYHVVNKTTGSVVKVGSTIRTLEKRWLSYNENFSNHFLRLAKEIASSELDQYDSENSDCPFLWHLAAAEHMEITRAGTFSGGPLSNKMSPLLQKFVGFDASESARIGGTAGGLKTRDEKLGIHNPSFDKSIGARKGGLKNVESGHLQSISSKGGLACGALMEKEKKGIFSPNYDRVAAGAKYGKISGKIGGPKGMHTRWHVRRDLTSPSCKYCTGQQNVDESAEHSQFRITLHPI